MLQIYSIHNQAKAYMLTSSCLKLAILILGQYRNAFLAYSILSRMRLQKYAFFLIQPKKLCEMAPQEWLSLAEPHRIEGAD